MAAKPLVQKRFLATINGDSTKKSPIGSIPLEKSQFYVHLYIIYSAASSTSVQDKCPFFFPWEVVASTKAATASIVLQTFRELDTLLIQRTNTPPHQIAALLAGTFWKKILGPRAGMTTKNISWIMGNYQAL